MEKILYKNTKRNYHDMLWELDKLCVCGSGRPFNACCGKV